MDLRSGFWLLPKWEEGILIFQHTLWKWENAKSIRAYFSLLLSKPQKWKLILLKCILKEHAKQMSFLKMHSPIWLIERAKCKSGGWVFWLFSYLFNLKDLQNAHMSQTLLMLQNAFNTYLSNTLQIPNIFWPYFKKYKNRTLLLVFQNVKMKKSKGSDFRTSQIV